MMPSSVASTARETPRAEALPQPGRRALAHVPGPWFPGSRTLNTLKILLDPLADVTRNVAAYGPVYKSNSFDAWNVVLVGPEANELVLANRERIFSSTLGWNPVLERVFPRGLMLLDGDLHQLHRRALGVAFRPEPMQRHLATMNDGIARGVSAWGSEELVLYPLVKQLTLDLAAVSFLGIELGPRAKAIQAAFADMIAASVGIVRSPWPGTAMRRGVAGREVLSGIIRSEIGTRRGSAGNDIFTQLCNTPGDEGAILDEQAIVDHMNFLMLAAHDTVTSSITAMVYFLGRHPEWQERVRGEIQALRAADGPVLRPDGLELLPLTEMAFSETLRLVPPVPSIPRRATADFEFRGHRIPAGAIVGLSPLYSHRMPDLWPEPERFDPQRFSAEACRGRHRFAWVPFGGGAHMCIGKHFAIAQAKTFFFHLLSERRVVLEPGYETRFRMFPIPRPRDGLKVRLARL